jgi:dTDP-4-amino-4,6-dideoxygalactose transaminase
MLDRLEAFTRARVDNATTLLTQLRSVDGIRLITPAPGSVPVYLRLPLLMPNASARERALADLDAAGIGATASYPASLVDVPELRPALANPDARATGGRFVAERIVTLPTHPYVACEDLAATVAALAAAATVPDTLAVAVPH